MALAGRCVVATAPNCRPSRSTRQPRFARRRRRRRTRQYVFTQSTLYGRRDLKPLLGSTLEDSTVMTEFVAETMLPTRHGLFRLRGYRHTVDDWATFSEPTAIISGKVEGLSEVETLYSYRAQSVDVILILSDLASGCAPVELELALVYLQEHPPGIIIYLQQEGRGIGLANKIAAYALQESGLDTVEANRALGFPDDCREYHSVYNILKDLDIKSVRLMTNNPRKVQKLEKLGISISDRIPCLVQPGAYNRKYLEAKEKKMSHLLDGSWCFWDHDGDSALPSSGSFSGEKDKDKTS